MGGKKPIPVQHHPAVSVPLSIPSIRLPVGIQRLSHSPQLPRGRTIWVAQRFAAVKPLGSRLDIYNTLFGERRRGGISSCSLPCTGAGAHRPELALGLHVALVCMCVCMCVCIHVYACIVCAQSHCSPSLQASSAQFCRLQQNEVSSPAVRPPHNPCRSPQPLHPRHSPSAGRDR